MEKLLTLHSMNFATDVEKFSVSTSQEKGLLVPNLIPLILDIITVQIAWMTVFYVKPVAGIRQGGDVFP